MTALPLGGTDLNLLVALKALLEEGNVTKAGAKIGKSQPAMSTALARLRRHYKDELLVRVGRDYELTPFAKTLVPSVRRTMNAVEAALAAGRAFDPRVSEHVFRLTATDYAITVLGEPLLKRVSELAPRVRLELDAIPLDMHESERGLMHCDALIGPLGFGFDGAHEPLFRTASCASWTRRTRGCARDGSTCWTSRCCRTRCAAAAAPTSPRRTGCSTNSGCAAGCR